jgi:hypothetical protein
MGNRHRMSTGHNPSRAALVRDAALQRVGRTRRWVIAGTAALTAGSAALVSAVAPGRSLASKSAASTGAAKTTASIRRAGSLPAMPPPANPSTLGLQGPNQAPSPAPDQSQSAPSGDSSQAQPTAPPAQAPQSSGGGGGVVSGGS